MDISFKMGDEKFNYRVSAIIISNGRILAMYHDKPSEYYSLPGDARYWRLSIAIPDVRYVMP